MSLSYLSKKVHDDRITRVRNMNTLVHISTNGSLPRYLEPRSPTSNESEMNVGDGLTEPDVPRICLSGSIIGSLQAIYPNICNLFEVDNVEFLDFYVYEADVSDSRYTVTPEVLTKMRLVHDAHVTKEYWTLTRLRLRKRSYRIRLYNPNDLESLMYYPFGDPSGPGGRRSLGPDLCNAMISII